MNKDLKLINEVLEDLIKSTQIIKAVIVDQNGLPIASINKKGDRLNDELENKISALTASVYLLSEKTSIIFNQGLMNQMLIKNERGKIFLTNINDQSLIICVMEKKASESLILLKLKRACAKLKNLDILKSKVDLQKDTDFFIPSID
ncbi:MAG: roadblock/LC7 domain-containing protein [Candidatus Helarchaeota archaeon]